MPTAEQLDTAVQYAEVLADQFKTYRLVLYQSLAVLHDAYQRVATLEATNAALRDELRRYTRAAVESAPGFRP